jgi:TonB family protein
MISSDCVRAEVTAGAVALGEATQAERDEYRRHLSVCRHCLTTLGGERDIERTMQLVTQGREAERWEPVVRGLRPDRVATKRQVWWLSFAAVATAALVSIGIGFHGRNPVKPAPQTVTVAHRMPVAPPQIPHRSAAGHDLVVLHKLVTLKRPPLEAAAPRVASNAPRHAARPIEKRDAGRRDPVVVAAAVPSQRDEGSLGALRTVGTAPPAPEHAESIAVLPAAAPNRDVVPVGGESAIVPHPSAIAYYENAEGTTAFDVAVDERGAPVKCSVTKSSGYLVLDVAVCRAAMHARYVPRIVNGHAVSSLYHDSITFKASSDDQ